MLDLVLWSGLLALTPWALGLAWKLISGAAVRIGPAGAAESVPLARPPACRRPPATLRGAICRSPHSLH
jgi:hypothetical protein